MRVAGDQGATVADQEIQIGPLVRLQHMLDVEPLPSALRQRRSRPLGPASGEGLIIQLHLNHSPGHVEGHRVTGANQCQRSARRGFGADV
jgi:hypothetical protein